MNPWLEFVKEYHKKHPKLSYSEALKNAKPLYHKQKKNKKGGNPLAVLGAVASPVVEGFKAIGNAVQNRREKNGFYRRESALRDLKLFKQLRADPQYADMTRDELWDIIKQKK